MAKKRVYRRFSRLKRRRTKRNTQIPLAIMAGASPPFIHLIEWALPPLQAGNIQGAAYNGAYSLLKDYAGYDLNSKTFNFMDAVPTYMALVGGVIGHKLASKFGVNRVMAKIPLIGKYIGI